MKRKGWITVALSVALLAAGAFGVYRWWQASSRASIIAASVPPKPNLSRWPLEMQMRIADCTDRAKNGPKPLAALEELSRLYHANGLYPQASDCYKGLIEADPDNPVWPHRLASIFANYGRLDDAIALWKRVIELDPAYLPATIRIGDCLIRKNEYKQAARYYHDALRRAPQNPYALLGLARIDVANEDWKAARQKLEAASNASDSQIGSDLLVTVYRHLGMTKQADQIVGKAKASGSYYDMKDPWIDKIYNDCYDPYRLAVAAGRAARYGDHQTELRLIHRAISLDPKNYTYHYQIALSYMNNGDLPDARDEFLKCTNLAPDFSDGWSNLVTIYRKLGNDSAATMTLENGLSNCPDAPNLVYKNAERLEKSGETEAAVSEFKRAISLMPEQADGYTALALLYIKNSQLDKAIKEIRASLAAEPDNPVALITMTLYYIGIHDEPHAREWFSKVRAQPRISDQATQRLIRKFESAFGHAPD